MKVNFKLLREAFKSLDCVGRAAQSMYAESVREMTELYRLKEACDAAGVDFDQQNIECRQVALTSEVSYADALKGAKARVMRSLDVRLREAQRAVDAWNRVNPRGTTVVLLNDHGEEELTRTRSWAFVLPDGRAAVHLDRKHGAAWLLSRLKVIREDNH